MPEKHRFPSGARTRIGSGQLEAKCPGCGAVFDGFTAMDLRRDRPQPGDVSICLYCAAALQYHGSPLSLRRLEGDALILARARPDFKLAEEVVKQVIAERAKADDEERQ